MSIPAPKTRWDIRKLLGLFGYCKLWLYQYTQSVKFLYDKLVNPEPVRWTTEDEEQLQELKDKLSSTPVLSLPDLKKGFEFFVNTEKGIAYGVLTQEWRGSKKPVAFLSKLLDPVARGWPTCLQVIAATAILLEEAQKLTLQGKIRIHTPHDLKMVLSHKAQQWLTDSQILKYEIMACKRHLVTKILAPGGCPENPTDTGQLGKRKKGASTMQAMNYMSVQKKE